MNQNSFQSRLKEVFQSDNWESGKMVFGRTYVIKIVQSQVYLNELFLDSPGGDKEKINGIGRISDSRIPYLLQAECQFEPLITFYWKSHEKHLNFLNISLLVGTEGTDYICVLQDVNDLTWQAVGAFSSSQRADVLEELPYLFLEENGRLFNLSLFPRVPDFTRNWRPDVVPTDEVFVSLCVWMDWASINNKPGWLFLKKELFGQDIGMKILKEDLHSIDPVWQDLSDKSQLPAGESVCGEISLTMEDKTKIMGEYFNSSYLGFVRPGTTPFRKD